MKNQRGLKSKLRIWENEIFVNLELWLQYTELDEGEWGRNICLYGKQDSSKTTFLEI